MFTKLHIDNYDRDKATFRAKVASSITSLPTGASVREKRFGLYFCLRVFFFGEETNFYISLDNEFYYFNEEENITQKVKLSDILEEFEKAKRYQIED